MLIKGHVTSTVNIRRAPDISGTFLGTITAPKTFEGNQVVKDGSGKDWLKLTRVDGAVVTDVRYIAMYIAAVKVDENIPDNQTPPNEEDLGIPENVTTIEEFRLPDGSIRRRTIVWNNPQVTE